MQNANNGHNKTTQPKTEVKKYAEEENNKVSKMPTNKPSDIETAMNLALRLAANWNLNKEISWETVKGFLTWPEMEGYNIRMALVVGVTKKHNDVIYRKGYGTRGTRAYQLHGLSNNRLMEFFNMEQGGYQARQFVNNSTD